LALRAALAMLGLPDFFVSGFLAFCLMISSNFYLNLKKKKYLSTEKSSAAGCWTSSAGFVTV
jgi:hypothetical protein